ncbi:MAG: hypothetical protein IME94_07445 [Proteobacteria bacterium]|nr:hypothetical protein [Pseudomonadota bacterium]
MGQKTNFNPEEWDTLEDLSNEDLSNKEKVNEDGALELDDFDSSIYVKVDEEYDSLEFARDPSEIFEDPSELLNDLVPENNQQLEQSKEQSKEKLQTRKIVISRKGSGKPISAQEEDAFRKQIQDLFDLLELEKEDLKEGVRVYQTDSSPSMPWRFH